MLEVKLWLAVNESQTKSPEQEGGPDIQGASEFVKVELKDKFILV